MYCGCVWPLQQRINNCFLVPNSDAVLSADMGFNLFMSNTAVSKNLSNKSAKSTHSRHPPSSVIIFNEGKLRLRKCYAFLTVLRAGCVVTRQRYFLFACACLVSSPCEDNKRSLLGTLFWCCSHYSPRSFPRTILSPVFSTNLLQSQAN